MESILGVVSADPNQQQRDRKWAVQAIYNLGSVLVPLALAENKTLNSKYWERDYTELQVTGRGFLHFSITVFDCTESVSLQVTQTRPSALQVLQVGHEAPGISAIDRQFLNHCG